MAFHLSSSRAIHSTAEVAQCLGEGRSSGKEPDVSGCCVSLFIADGVCSMGEVPCILTVFKILNCFFKMFLTAALCIFGDYSFAFLLFVSWVLSVLICYLFLCLGRLCLVISALPEHIDCFSAAKEVKYGIVRTSSTKFGTLMFRCCFFCLFFFYFFFILLVFSAAF